MNISEVSDRFGVSTATLRYYESEHLMPPVRRNQSGYREYTDVDINWIYFIKALRKAGVGVTAIQKFTQLCLEDFDGSADERKQILIDQYQKLIDQRKKLNQAIDYLEYKIDNFEEHMQNMSDQLDPYIKEHPNV